MARLHKDTISNGFLSLLGESFLESMYSYLIKKEMAFVYCGQEKVEGFVSLTKSSPKMMKSFLLHKPGSLIILAFSMLTKPGLWIKMAETFLAPFKTTKNKSSEPGGSFPPAELLSISVSPVSQNSGIGSQLVEALDELLIREKINRYKVVVGQELLSANRFYQKNGFVLAGEVTIHGKKISNVYIKELEVQ